MEKTGPANKLFLSVVIPAYNEEKRLAKTLRDVLDYLDKQAYGSEVLVVNDGSTDETSQLVRGLEKINPRLRLIDNKINHGKGFAVKSGMLQATGDYRIFMDADGSTSIGEVGKLLGNILSYDVVIGSRRVRGALIINEQPRYRLVLGWFFRDLVNMILPLGVTDTQNGFKLFSGKAAGEIFSKQTVNGWAFDVEVLFLAKKLGYKVKEVPIVWTDDRQSKVTVGGMVRMLTEILKIRTAKYF